MTSSVVTVKAADDVEAAADAIEEHQLRRLVVVVEGGRAVGIVAQADLALDTDDELTGDVVEGISRPKR